MERKSACGRSRKEALLNEAKRCRKRLEMLKGLRNSVLTTVNEACAAVEETISQTEMSAEGADSSQVKALYRELRAASNVVRKYESALEAIIYFDDLDDESDQLADSDLLTISGVREVSATASVVSAGSAYHPLSPLPLAQPPARVSPAVPDSDLIRFTDMEMLPSPPSPGLDPAESCGSSLYPDAAGIQARAFNTAAGIESAIVLEGNSNTRPKVAMEQVTRAPSGRDEAAIAANDNLQNAVGTCQIADTKHEAGQVVQFAAVGGVQVQPNAEPASRDNTKSTRPFSDSVESTTSSPADTSSHSGTADDHQFVEGGSVPRGKFHFADDSSVRFYMRYILSPDEFYVQPLSHETSTAFSQLRRDLAQFYERQENRKPLFQEGETTCKLGTSAVCARRNNFTNDQEIERCEILGSREASLVRRAHGMHQFEVQVRFIDLGNKQWVSSSQLWKIDRRFCNVPALTIQCRLFDTRPREEGLGTAFGCWNENAVSVFKALCVGDRPITGYVLNKREPFSLMVNIYRGLSKQCLNAILVVEKVAKTITNFSIAAERVLDQSQCSNNNRFDDCGANMNVDFLCFGAEAKQLPSPTVNTTVLVEVQKFFTCCRFSVNFPIGVGDIHQIRKDPRVREIYEDPIRRYETAMNEMNEFYARDNTLVFDQWPLVGQLVASKFSEDERYYRARLLDVVPQDHSTRVRYVDYGNDEWVSIQSLRPLPAQFLSLPYMAMECSLAGTRPLPRASMAADNINTLTEEARSHSPDKYLLARIVRVVPRQPPAGPMLSVILTSEDGSVNFNNYVVQQRWAEKDHS